MGLTWIWTQAAPTYIITIQHNWKHTIRVLLDERTFLAMACIYISVVIISGAAIKQTYP